MKRKINLDDDLPQEKAKNMNNVVILIKTVLNENRSHYYYQKFLENVRINNRCIIINIAKSEAINLLRNAGFNEKTDHY